MEIQCFLQANNILHISVSREMQPNFVSEIELPDSLLADDPKSILKPESGKEGKIAAVSSSVSSADSPEKANDDKEEERKLVPFTAVFKYANGCDRAFMILGLFFAFLAGAGMPGFSYVFGELLDDLTADQSAGGALRNIEKTSLLMVYFGIGEAVLFTLYIIFLMTSSSRIVSRIEIEFLRRILRQDSHFFDEVKPGKIASRLHGDTKVLKASINDKLGNGMMNFGMFIFGFALGFYTSWRLTLIMCTTLPLIAGVGALMAHLLEKALSDSRKHFAKSADIADEVIQNIRSVQAYSGEEREAQRFEATLEGAREAGTKKEVALSIGMGITFGVMFSSYAVAFSYSAFLVKNGHHTVGEIITTFFSVLMGSFGLGLSMPALAAIAEARGACYGLYEIMDRLPKIDVEQPGRTLQNFKGDFELRNVRFSYPTKLNDKLFTDLNIKVQAGMKIAFVGASGCGKSSVVQLLQRMYDPIEGQVLIDGVDLKDLDLQWWRSKTGVVSQEPNLFSGTVLDNIRVGKEDATLEEVQRACEQANIHDTIMSLPQQYNTQVGSIGSQLSGGQKQRIAIARAIIKNPAFLILDEATSALDRKSEQEVQAALDNIVDSEKRTTVVIAHRLVTIQHCDCIFFVKHDQVTGSMIAESGTYDELMAKRGEFALMANKQAKSMTVLQSASGSPTSAFPYGAGNAWIESENAVYSSHLETKKADTMPIDIKSQPTKDFHDMMDEESDTHKAGVGKIIPLLEGKKCFVFLGLCGSLISGGIYPVYAVFLSKVLSILGTTDPNDIMKESWPWVVGFVALGILAFIGWALQSFYGIAGEHLTKRIRGLLFRSILKQPQQFFDARRYDPGGLGALLSGEAEKIHLLWGPSLGYKVQMACNIIVGLTIGLFYSWKIALVALATIPFMAAGGMVQQILLLGFGRLLGTDKENTLVNEASTNAKTVMQFNYGKRILKSYRTQCESKTKYETCMGIGAGIAGGLGQFMIFGAFALVFWYGGTLLNKGEVNFEQLMIASFAVLMAAFGVGEAGGFSMKVQGSDVATRKVFAVIDRTREIDADDENGSTDLGRGAALGFKGVSFKYPARPQAEVLKKFDSTLHDGQQVGLMGSTGCGKSTIIQLLMGFYRPSKGQVTVNGKDLASLKLRASRDAIAYVPQEPALFSGSIKENIRYSQPDASDKEVYEVAKLAQVYDDTMQRAEGFDFDVGYKGRLLSGGQKQRVAIARALLRNPRLLLLDEATSALDNATEARVMEGITKKYNEHPMTIVSIAHRLTTIRHSDRIVLLDEGIVLEEGSHDELMAIDGDYAARWTMYNGGSA